MLAVLFSLSPACTGPEIGAAEDSLGQPRALLANCTRSAGEDSRFPHTVYDAHGYRMQELSFDGQVSREWSTTLDELGRPVRRTLGLEVLWQEDEISYVDETWRVDAHRITSEFYGDAHWVYSWGSGGAELEDVREVPEEERLCPRVIVFAVGLRPALDRSYCEDQSLESEFTTTWREDRVAQVVARNRFGHQDVTVVEYRYDAEGRLAAETWTADPEGDGVFDAPQTQKYSWSCQ